MDKNTKLWLGLITIVLTVVVVMSLMLVTKKPQDTTEQIGGIFDYPGNVISLGGNRLYGFSASNWPTGTTTPCAFQVKATSTLMAAKADITTGSSTATTWGWYKGTTSGDRTATTTLLNIGEVELGAGLHGFVIASTSEATDTDDWAFAPNDMLILAARQGDVGAKYGNLDYAGTCSALFDSF